MELAHAPEVRGRESADTGATSTDGRGKATDGILAPSVPGDAAADVFTHSPVEVNQLRVDRLEGPLTGRGLPKD